MAWIADSTPPGNAATYDSWEDAIASLFNEMEVDGVDVDSLDPAYEMPFSLRHEGVTYQVYKK